MDPLGDPLATCPMQPGWEFTIKQYCSSQFGCIDNPDRQCINSWGGTSTPIRSDGPELLLTLLLLAHICHCRSWYTPDADLSCACLGRVSHCGGQQSALAIIPICDDNAGLPTQWIENTSRERIQVIAEAMSIMNNVGSAYMHWDVVMDCFFTWISDLLSKRLLWKWYMANQTNLNH